MSDRGPRADRGAARRVRAALPVRGGRRRGRPAPRRARPGLCPLPADPRGVPALSGDLALGRSPATPPETLLPRIHRAIEEVPLAGRRPRRGALVAAAASVAALVAMGGLSLVLGSRASDAETQAGTALEILSLMRSPGAQPVDVTPQGTPPRRAAWSRSRPRTSTGSTWPRSSAPTRPRGTGTSSGSGRAVIGARRRDVHARRRRRAARARGRRRRATTRSGSPKRCSVRPRRTQPRPVTAGARICPEPRATRPAAARDQTCSDASDGQQQPDHRDRRGRRDRHSRPTRPDSRFDDASRALSATIPTTTSAVASPRLNAQISASP